MSDAQLVPCPFVTYERAKTPPTREKYAELVKWRGETHVFLPRLSPLPEEDVAVTTESDRSQEFTCTLVRLSDNKEFTSAPIPVGEDYPSSAWGDNDQHQYLVVQFDDGEEFEEPVGRPDYNERRRYRKLRHVYFELDADAGVLAVVRETGEDDGATDPPRYNQFSTPQGWSNWKHGRMNFEGSNWLGYLAPRKQTNYYYPKWVENPVPRFEGHDTGSGWKPQDRYREIGGEPQYFCLFEFNKHQRTHCGSEYALSEDDSSIRVVDLEVMYEIVCVKETLRETARFTLDEDKYSGARKTCLVANARRFFRDIFRKRIVDAEMRDLRESLQVWRGNTMAEFMQNERRKLLLYDIQQTFGDLFREDIDYVDDRIQELLAEDEEDEESAGGRKKRPHLELADLFPNLRF